MCIALCGLSSESGTWNVNRHNQNAKEEVSVKENVLTTRLPQQLSLQMLFSVPSVKVQSSAPTTFKTSPSGWTYLPKVFRWLLFSTINCHQTISVTPHLQPRLTWWKQKTGHCGSTGFQPASWIYLINSCLKDTMSSCSFHRTDVSRPHSGAAKAELWIIIIWEGPY